MLINKDRFAEISVVVVDFEMPNMNGEEVCRKLKDSPIKIIMLTGEADELMAIKLFNAGLIDKFILKGQPDLNETLKNSIIEMQKNYFQDLTNPIVQGLATDEGSSLKDPVFTDFFDKICHDISASSYYLIELSGSFIFMDDAGTVTWLIIKTLDELKEIANQMEDANLPSELVNSVREGKMVPYFPDIEENFYSDKLKFAKHLYKAEILKGNKNYSYALIKQLEDFPFEASKVLSFYECINQI